MAETTPQVPDGVNHLVLNVRDMDRSHAFYTEVLGYEQVGELGEHIPMSMQFYSTHGKHHDIALVQMKDPDPEPIEEWDLMKQRGRVNHIAIGYPNRETFLKQLEHMAACGVDVKMRGNHGMTHSAYISDPDGNGIEVLYELPREVWEGDIDGALNYFKPMPTSGPASLVDDDDYVTFPLAE